MKTTATTTTRKQTNKTSTFLRLKLGMTFNKFTFLQIAFSVTLTRSVQNLFIQHKNLSM